MSRALQRNKTRKPRRTPASKLLKARPRRKSRDFRVPRWGVLLAIGVAFIGAVGGAFALVASQVSDNPQPAMASADGDEVGRLIEDTVLTSPEFNSSDPDYDEGLEMRSHAHNSFGGSKTEEALPTPVMTDAYREPPELDRSSQQLDSHEAMDREENPTKNRRSSLTVASKNMPDLASPQGPAIPLWRKNAVATVLPSGQPAIAIVLDDVGVAQAHAEMAIDLPAEVTLSFMTYAANLSTMTAAARSKGHELMVHFPMQPLDPSLSAGPNALLVGMDRGELLRRLDWGLGRFDGYVGINNHMGSSFTRDPEGMRVVMEVLRDKGLLFLDSKTVADSLGPRLARQFGVVNVARDIFLDNDTSGPMLAKQLREVEQVALQRGDAIAIGHPHPETIAALRAWIPEAKSRGFAIVPLSAIVERRIGPPG